MEHIRSDITQYDSNPESHPNTVGIYRLPISYLTREYVHSAQIQQSIDILKSSNISHYRKSRGDGNCYFRAVGVLFLELQVRLNIISQFADTLRVGRGTWAHVCLKNKRYSSYLASVIELFVGDTAMMQLQWAVQDAKFDKCLVWVFRWACVQFFKNNLKNPDIACFLDEDNTIKHRTLNLITDRYEADGITFALMCNATRLKICHHTVTVDYAYSVEDFVPFQGASDTIHLLWRPGHYDILYTQANMADDQYDFESATICGNTFADLPGTPFSKQRNTEAMLTTLWPDTPAMLSRWSKYAVPRISDIETMPYDKRGTNDLYLGRYVSGKKEGFGVTVNSKEGVIIGEYRRGKLDGQAVTIQPEFVYIGGFTKGRRHGRGKLKCHGYFYRGTWCNGKRHGLGIERYTNQDSYEGEFCEGERTGRGTLVQYQQANVTWTYTGNFDNGQLKGDGKLVIINPKLTLEIEGNFQDLLNLKREGRLLVKNEIQIISFINGKIAKIQIYKIRRKNIKMGLWDRLVNWLKSLFWKQELEISIVGLQNAGKSTFVNVLATSQFDEETIPTIGFNYRAVKKGGVQIKMWDLGGHPRFRESWEKYCRKVDCIIYVVDSADFGNLESSRTQLHQLMNWPSLAGIPLLLLGNKNDLEGSLTEEELISQLNLQMIVGRPIACYSVSAKNSTNIDTVLKYLTSVSKFKK